MCSANHGFKWDISDGIADSIIFFCTYDDLYSQCLARLLQKPY